MPLSKLRPAPGNPRRIRPERLEQLKRALEADREMLAVRPLVALPDGTVVMGNQRLRAAQELGWKSIPCVTVELDAERARLWMLRDNQGYGEWDEEPLAALLAELAEQGADLDLAGFAERELVQFMASTRGGLTDPDELPEPPKKPRSRRGEVYELGPHRLMCGDSTDAEAVEQLTGGASVSAAVTDPPYGINRDGVENDDPRRLRGLFDGMLATAPLTDAVVVAFQSPRLVTEWIDAVRAAGHRWERLLWLHRQAAKTYPWRGWVLASDAIAVSSVGSPAWPDPSDFCHDTYVKTELEDASLTGSHTTIKPSWVVADLLSKLPVGAVYEPFAGSGTTLIAAEQLGRQCFAVEIDPVYCDVIRKRYADYVGRADLAP